MLVIVHRAWLLTHERVCSEVTPLSRVKITCRKRRENNWNWPQSILKTLQAPRAHHHPVKMRLSDYLLRIAHCAAKMMIGKPLKTSLIR